jgi:hypothetical protein
LVVFGFTSDVFGQSTFSAYRGTWYPMMSYYNFKKQRQLESGTPTTNFEENHLTANGFTLGVYGGASLIGLLFDDDSRFFIGEYWGGGLGVSSMKRINLEENGGKTNSFGATASFDLGISTGFAVGENLEIGLQALFFHLYYTTDLNDQLAFQQSPLIIPSVKYANLMVNFGFGKGVIGGNGFRSEDNKLLFIEPRIFNDDADRYLFVRYERNWQTSPSVTTVSDLVSTQPMTINTYGYRESVKASILSFGLGLTF